MTNQEFIKALREMLGNIGEYEEKDNLAAKMQAELFDAYWTWSENKEQKGEEKKSEKSESLQALNEKFYEDLKKFTAQFPEDYSDNAETLSDELEFEFFKILCLYFLKLKENDDKRGAFLEQLADLIEKRKSKFLRMANDNSLLKRTPEIFALLENEKLFTLQNFDTLNRQEIIKNVSFPISFLYCLQNLNQHHFPFDQKIFDALCQDPSSAHMIAHCLQMIKVANKLIKKIEDSKASTDPAEKEQLYKLINLAKDNIQSLFKVSKYGSQIRRFLLRNLSNQKGFHNLSLLFETIRYPQEIKSNDENIFEELTRKIDRPKTDYYEPDYSGEALDELEIQPSYDSLSAEEKAKFVLDYTNSKKEEFKKYKESRESQEAKEVKEAEEVKRGNLAKLIKFQEDLQSVIYDKFYHLNPSGKADVVKAMSKDEKLSAKIPTTHPLMNLMMSFTFFESVKKSVKDIPVKNIIAEHFANKEKKEYKAEVDEYSKKEFGAEALRFTNKILESLDINNVCVIDTGMLQTRIERNGYWSVSEEDPLINLLKKLQAGWPPISEIPYKRYIAMIIPTLPNAEGVPQHATLMLIDRDQLRIECIDSYGEAEGSGLPFIKRLLNTILHETFDDYMEASFYRRDDVPSEITESVRKLYDELCAYKVVYPPNQIQIQQTDQTTCVPHTVANLIGMVTEKENYQFDSKMDSKSEESAVAFLKKLRIDVESGHGIGQRSAEDLFDIIGIMKLGLEAYHAEEQLKEARLRESKADVKSETKSSPKPG